MSTDPSAPAPRPSEPRVAPVAEFDAEVAEILANALTVDGTPLNIFGTLAHHPKLLKRFNLLGGFLLNKGLIPAREREIVILRVGWNAQAVYEFGQHTLIGKQTGLTDDEIAAIAGGSRDWSDDDRALIDLADDLCRDDVVSDDTWARLGRWSDAEKVELVIVAGFYRLVSGFLNTMGVQLDNGVPSWPGTD
ncbi:MAG: carboxymuconolactone decarboxylase family protein [Acidimicrobiales bacterium]